MYGALNFWAEFQYVPGTLNFVLSQVGVIGDEAGFDGCQPGSVSEGLDLYIPAITWVANGSSLWADFSYLSGLSFQVSAAGIH